MASSRFPGSVDSSGNPYLPHYPDLVEQGGLRAAILSMAREQQVSLGIAADEGRLTSQEWSGAEFASPRGVMRIVLGRGSRRFAITLDSDIGHVWASGSTASLHKAVEVLSFWLREGRLRDLANQFPFMEFDRLSLAYEDGNPVEVQWEIIIGDDSFLLYRDLLLALHADANLRVMFPFFSHWTLRMLKDCYDPQAGEICIKLEPGKGFVIFSSSTPEQKFEFIRIDDLIRVAASMLGDL
ncbi:hypothetical protein PUR57_03065 [Streptomyces sp. JV176]|uniref:hypothetical protein n=1 Tax=Streptomyces sp. JV176 TaxID=858630 RepID=UPI002E79E38B|nr:hypothetical protein [Streptomyces sp. JV176]MEE1797666.1 hypothetical protein [Streptomyces sp. JV176]